MSYDWPDHSTTATTATAATTAIAGADEKEAIALVTPQESDLTTLTHAIIEWRRMKEANDSYRQQVRELSKKMKALEEIIVRIMKSHNIGALDLKSSGGRVLFKKQKHKGSLGQKDMERLVSDFLKSEDEAKKLLQHLQDARTVVIKETIQYEKIE